MRNDSDYGDDYHRISPTRESTQQSKPSKKTTFFA